MGDVCYQLLLDAEYALPAAALGSSPIMSPVEDHR